MNLKNKIRIITCDNPFNLAKKTIEDKPLFKPTFLSEIITIDWNEYSVVYNGLVIKKKEQATTLITPETIINIIRTVGSGQGAEKAAGVAIMFASMGLASAVGGGLLGAGLAGGVSFLGGFIISLFEPAKKDNSSPSQNYGWNSLTPKTGQSSPVEITYGSARMKAPQILGITTSGSDTSQYLCMILSAGEGPLDSISDIQVNGNPYDPSDPTQTNIQSDFRYGTNDQGPLLLIPELLDAFSSLPLSLLINTTPQIAETNSNYAKSIEISLDFAQGIYAMTILGDSTRSYNPAPGDPLQVKFIIKIDYRVAGTSPWTTVNWNFHEQVIGPTRRTYRIDGLAPEPYEVRLSIPLSSVFVNYWRREWSFIGVGNIVDDWSPVTLDDSGNFYYGDSTGQEVNMIIGCTWDSLNCYISAGLIRQNKALVALKINATSVLNGGIPTVTWTQTRNNVWVWNPYTVAYEQQPANNPWWAAYDMIHYARQVKNINTGLMEFIVYGAPADSMLYDEFKDCADYCSANGITFNFILDAAGTLQDALKFCQDIGRGTVLIKGTSWGCTMDKPGDAVQIFTMGNIIPKTFKETFLAIASRANNVEISFTDSSQSGWPETVMPVYAKDWDDTNAAQNPTQLKLNGIITQAQAYKQGKYYLRCNIYLIRTCEFQVGLDALASEVGDIIKLQHDVPQWGFGGRVISQPAINQIKLDRQVTFEPGTNYSITIRHSESDTMVTYTASSSLPTILVTDTITIYTALFAPLIPYDDIWAFGETNIVTKPFRITAITRAMELTRKITCMEYNPAIYDESDLTNGIVPVINYSQLRTSVEVVWLGAAPDTRMASDGTHYTNINVSWQLPHSQGEIINAFRVCYSLNGGPFIFWEITSTYQTTITDMQLGNYTVRIQTINIQGLVSNGKVSNNVAVTNALTAPPDPDGLTLHQLMDGTWQLAVIYNQFYPADFLGWVYKIRSGTRAYWQDATALTAAPTQGSIIISSLPAGEQTLMVKMQLKGGEQSVNFALAVANIGDPILPNIIGSYDMIALIDFTVTNGSVASSHIIADVDSGGLFWQANNQSPAWNLTGSILFWSRSTYKQMTVYSTLFSFGTLSGLCSLDFSIAGPYDVYYKLAPSGPYQKYTGPFSFTSGQEWYFMVVTYPGAEQGDISKFKITTTSPPLIDSLPNIAISSGGTRVAPTKTFQAITACQATLQISSGYPAITIVFSDRDPVLGAIWQGYDAAGSPAAAMADIKYEGY